MVWIKRSILSLPFLIAAVLTILMAGADHFHLYRERDRRLSVKEAADLKVPVVVVMKESDKVHCPK